jgi:hypothetical protein
MKKKINVTFRARMIARGFQQIGSENYDSTPIAATVRSQRGYNQMHVCIDVDVDGMLDG